MLSVAHYALQRARGRDIFGQVTVPAPAPVPTNHVEVPAQSTNTVIMKAIPDNIPVRCKFDNAAGVWRCEHTGLFERTSTWVFFAGAVGILFAGYFLGRTDLLKAVAFKVLK